jgi:hypothetical protein
VVEHPLGKGEVVSSILTGSTRKAHEIVAVYVIRKSDDVASIRNEA